MQKSVLEASTNLPPSVTTIDETAKPVQIKVAGTVNPHVSIYVTAAIE